MSSWRLSVLLAGFFIFGILLVARLFYWQIIYAEKLQALAESQHFAQQEIPALRGQILASDGFPLATSRQSFLVWADLTAVNLVPEEIASRLAPILNSKETEETKKDLSQRLKRKDIFWTPLARKVELETKQAIKNLEIVGIGFEEEEKRFYPESSMSAHLLGFVGQDSSGKDKGYFGLEGFYDRILGGRPGLVRQEKDASGKPILIGRTNREEAIPGRDLEIYLDRAIQFMIEEKLKEGLMKYGAKAGSVVIMDPANGGILALANFPNYDPVNYAQEEQTLFSNPVVNQTFEPGSILKVLVMASALEEKAVVPFDRCPCAGPVTIGEYTIRTWDDKYHPSSTMVDVIVHSDNVGMVWVGEKLGSQKLASYLERFGLDEQTGIDLEGEVTSSLRPWERWSQIDLATASFGQGVAVTPIQMVRAVGTIANGGELLEPHVVSKIKSSDKEVEIKPKVIREVISPTTAKVMTEMMINAVKAGEAKWAAPKGYRIAGKTGTAQIPLAGHYDKEKTIASFVGFAPADKPKFVMLVTLQEPTSSPWGSETAAPLWFNIAKDLFNYFGITPDF